MIDKKIGIPGVTITAGKLNNISVYPNESYITSRRKSQLYTIKFTTTNTVPKSGKFTLSFRTNFNHDDNNIVYVNSGLSASSIFEPIVFDYSSSDKTLTISNFEELKSQEVSITVELTNPPNSGLTQAIIITSYDVNGNIIDQNLSDATTTISGYTKPGITVDFDSYETNTAVTGIFTLIPNVQIPAQGYITFKFPELFKLDAITNTLCELTPKNVAIDSSEFCSKDSNKITVKLFASTSTVPSESGSFIAFHDSVVKFSSIITNPKGSGYYNIDVETYDKNMILLESGSVDVQIIPMAFGAPTANPIHTVTDTKTVLKINFIVPIDIPSGVVPIDLTSTYGLIELKFQTKVSNQNMFRSDLGLNKNQKESIECKSIASPDLGNIKCYLAYKPSTIETTEFINVYISNFDAIAASSNSYEVYFPGIKYLQSPQIGTIVLTSYIRSGHIQRILNQSGLSLLAPTPAPASTVSAADISSLNTDLLATNTIMITNIITTSDTTTTNPLLILEFDPTHGESNCPEIGDIECQVNGIVEPCWCFSEAD